MANTQLNDSLFYSDTNIYYNDKEILFNHTNLLKPNSFNLTSVKDDEGNTFYELWFVDKDRQLTQLTYNILEGNGISLDENKRWKINMDNITIQENQDNQLYINNEYIIKAYGSQTKGVIKVKNENPHINIYEPNNNIGSIIINDRGQISISPTILGLISQIEESKSTINSLIEEIDKMLNLQQFDNSTDLTVGDIIYYNDFIGFSKYTTSIKDDPNWRPYYVCVISSGVLPDGKARIMNVNNNSLMNIKENISTFINEANSYKNIPVFNGNYEYDENSKTYIITGTQINSGTNGYIATDSKYWKKYYNPLNNIEHYNVILNEEEEQIIDEGENNINIIGMYIDNGIEIEDNFYNINPENLYIYIASDFKHVFNDNFLSLTIPKLKLEYPWYYPYTDPAIIHEKIPLGYVSIEYENVEFIKSFKSFVNLENIYVPYGQTYNKGKIVSCHSDPACVLVNRNKMFGVSNENSPIVNIFNPGFNDYSTYNPQSSGEINSEKLLKGYGNYLKESYIYYTNIGHNSNTMIYYDENNIGRNQISEYVINLYNYLYSMSASNPYVYGKNLVNNISKNLLTKKNNSELLVFGASSADNVKIKIKILVSTSWLSVNNSEYLTKLNNDAFTISVKVALSAFYKNTNLGSNTSSNYIYDYFFDMPSGTNVYTDITSQYNGNVGSEQEILNNVKADVTINYYNITLNNNHQSDTGISIGNWNIESSEEHNSDLNTDQYIYKITATVTISGYPKRLCDTEFLSIINQNAIQNKQIIIATTNSTNLPTTELNKLSIDDQSSNLPYVTVRYQEGQESEGEKKKTFDLTYSYITISDMSGNYNNAIKYNKPIIDDAFCNTYFKYSYITENNIQKTFEFPSKYFVHILHSSDSEYTSNTDDTSIPGRFTYYIVPSDDYAWGKVNLDAPYAITTNYNSSITTYFNIFDYYNLNSLNYTSYYVDETNTNKYIFSNTNVDDITYFSLNNIYTDYNSFISNVPRRYQGGQYDSRGSDSGYRIYYSKTPVNYPASGQYINGKRNAIVPRKFYTLFNLHCSINSWTLYEEAGKIEINITLKNNAFVNNKPYIENCVLGSIEYTAQNKFTVNYIEDNIQELYIPDKYVYMVSTQSTNFIVPQYYDGLS